jgi:hypothetical protein
MRACPAGLPVKAHAPVTAGFQHPASAVAPRGHRSDEEAEARRHSQNGVMWMRARQILAAAVMAGAFGAAQARAPQPPHDFGPPPTWNAFREAAEAGIRARLRDPDSAKFRWESGFAPGRWTLVDGYPWGYAACGFVNARNAYGGYVGETAFAVVIENGQVVGADLDRPTDPTLEIRCRKAAFPPIPTDASATSPSRTSSPTAVGRFLNISHGLKIMIVPDGAYVVLVEQASDAAKEGIKTGMVIELVNGSPIKGLDVEALNQAIASAGNQLTLTMIGGRSYVLGGALL